MKISCIGSVTDAIAHIPDFQALIPRGKFDMFFLKKFFKNKWTISLLSNSGKKYFKIIFST